jgi:hypothetical protein
MSYANLTALRTDVNNYLESDISESLFTPLVVTAEDRIHSLVHFKDQNKTQTASISAGTALVSLPSDFSAFISFSVNTNPSSSSYIFLQEKTQDFLREAFPIQTTQGVPRYYCIEIASSSSGTQLRISPPPSETYEYQLNYLGKPTSITTASNTDLGLLYPELLLFGTLVECANYLKEPADVVANYENRFQQSVVRAKSMSEGQATRDQYRYGQIRSIPN